MANTNLHLTITPTSYSSLIDIHEYYPTDFYEEKDQTEVNEDSIEIHEERLTKINNDNRIIGVLVVLFVVALLVIMAILLVAFIVSIIYNYKPTVLWGLISINPYFIVRTCVICVFVFLWWISSHDEVFKYTSDTSMVFAVFTVFLGLSEGWFPGCVSLFFYAFNVFCILMRSYAEKANPNKRAEAYKRKKDEIVLVFIWTSSEIMESLRRVVFAVSVCETYEHLHFWPDLFCM